MRRYRFTISWWMAATAVLGVNIAVVRAFLLFARDLEGFGFLMFFALQFGLWRHLRTRGRARRFWLGFELSGLAATLALFELPLERLFDWYTDTALDLSYLYSPRQVDDWLMQHWHCFQAILYFLPEFLAATLGGLLAASLFKAREETGTEIREDEAPAESEAA